MKTIADESEESGEDSLPLASLISTEKEAAADTEKELRPVRTAKSKANQNLVSLKFRLLWSIGKFKFSFQIVEGNSDERENAQR